SPICTTFSAGSMQKSTGWEGIPFPARREFSTLLLPFCTPLFQSGLSFVAGKVGSHLWQQCAGQTFHRRFGQSLCLVCLDDLGGRHPSFPVSIFFFPSRYRWVVSDSLPPPIVPLHETS